MSSRSIQYNNLAIQMDVFFPDFSKKAKSSMPQYSKRAALSVLHRWYSTVLRDEYSYSILESTELSRDFFAHVNEIRHGQ